MCIAALAQRKRLAEVDGSQEVSGRVVVPDAVGERVSLASLRPYQRQTVPPLA